MSKYNNVNPDHYKLAGRERPGKTAPVKARARSTEAEERARWSERQKNELRGNSDEVSDEEPREEEPREEEQPKQEPEV